MIDKKIRGQISPVSYCKLEWKERNEIRDSLEEMEWTNLGHGKYIKQLTYKYYVIKEELRLCQLCLRDYYLEFILKDGVWLRYFDKKDCYCFQCAELKMDRKITCEDLISHNSNIELMYILKGRN